MSQRKTQVRIGHGASSSSTTSSGDSIGEDSESTSVAYESLSSGYSPPRRTRGFSAEKRRCHPPPFRRKPATSENYHQTRNSKTEAKKRLSPASDLPETRRRPGKPKVDTCDDDSMDGEFGYFSRPGHGGFPIPPVAHGYYNPYYGGPGPGYFSAYGGYGSNPPPPNPFNPMMTGPGLYNSPVNHIPPHMQQYSTSYPPPPPPTEPKTPAPPPEPPRQELTARESVNPEIERLKRELEMRREELLAKEKAEKQKAEIEKLRKEIEGEFQIKLDAVRKAEAEARQEIEKVKAEAEAAARKAVESEIKASAERGRLHLEAIEHAKIKAREELRRELEAELEKKEQEEAKERSLKLAEEKLAHELELQRRQREEDEITRHRLLAELKQQIRAELMEEQNKALGSTKSHRQSRQSSRCTTETPCDSAVDPFEFFEGYSTPHPVQSEPVDSDELHFAHRQLPAFWSHQIAMSNGRNQAYVPVRQRISLAFEHQDKSRYHEPPFHQDLPAPEVDAYSQRQHCRCSRSVFRCTSANEEDSDKVTVIPLSRLKPTDSKPLENGIENLNLASGSAGMSNATPSTTSQENNKIADRLGKQRIANWTAATFENQSQNDIKVDAGPEAVHLQEDIPDVDGGAELENRHAPEPRTSKFIPSSTSNGGDEINNRRHMQQSSSPSPARTQATRDSPLLPFLAKHLSDYEETVSRDSRHQRAENKGPRLTERRQTKEFLNPYFHNFGLADGSKEEITDPTRRYSVARPGEWQTSDHQSRWPNSTLGTINHEGGVPMALVPCVMVPLQMVQFPMPILPYQGTV